MRVMIDTNILISGMLFDGTERLLLNYARKNKFTLLLCKFSLIETRDVLSRKFPGKEYILEEMLKMLPVEIAAVPSQEKINKAEKIIRDAKDAVILAAAIENAPDVFISGDKDFRTQEVSENLGYTLDNWDEEEKLLELSKREGVSEVRDLWAPVRFIGDSLGAEVDWDSDDREV